MNKYSCKFCGNLLPKPFLSLGEQPLCNSYILPENSHLKEKSYPLDVFFCASCYLVQLAHSIPPSVIFEDYAYLSSYSDTWLKHAADYSQKVTEKRNESGFLVEKITETANGDRVREIYDGEYKKEFSVSEGRSEFLVSTINLGHDLKSKEGKDNIKRSD